MGFCFLAGLVVSYLVLRLKPFINKIVIFNKKIKIKIKIKSLNFNFNSSSVGSI